MVASQGLRPGPGRLLGAALFVGTIVAIVAVAVLPLLTPLFIHPALDAAGSASRLGVEPGTASHYSDLSVGELVVGPGTFAFAGPDGTPFYTTDERGHLRDARALLWLCLIAGAVALVGSMSLISRAAGEERRAAWRIVSHAAGAAAAVVLLLALISLVAFDALFTVFHQVFFPGGNWAFDPATQRLVQLYPFAFWQVAAAALGVLVLLLSLAAWWLGRRFAQSGAPRAEPVPAAGAPRDPPSPLATPRAEDR